MSRKRILRHIGRKGYKVFKDPHGRWVKTRLSAKTLPSDWEEVKPRWAFEKDGKLTEKAHGLVDIKTGKHARWFSSVYNINIGLIFGSIDAKGKEDFF